MEDIEALKQKSGGVSTTWDATFKMEIIVLAILAGAILLPSIAFAGVIEDYQRDYQWR